MVPLCAPPLAGEICRSHKVFLHTDAAQAVGKVRVDVNAMNIDLMSISGHKIYGPKGDEPCSLCLGVYVWMIRVCAGRSVWVCSRVEWRCG